MTEREYIEIFDSLRENLTESNAQETLKKIDQLYDDIKPVRLKCLVAWGEAAFKCDYDVNVIFRVINEQGWYLYNYSGIEELADLYSRLNVSYGDTVDALRNRALPWVCIEELADVHTRELAELTFRMRQREEAFLDDVYSNDTLLELQESYFILGKYVSYALVTYLMEQREVEFIPRDFVNEIVNYGYLKERIVSKQQDTFIIMASEDNLTECEVAATILSFFEKQVFLIGQLMECPVDYEINIADTVPISVENMEECDGVQVITPFDIILDGKSIGDNRAELIAYLAGQCSSGGLATVLAAGELFDDLCETSVLQKKMERLDNFNTDGLEKALSFGWAGDYLAYISHIYGMDVRKAIERPAECDFSIVIPARNSAYYLKDTMRTCLGLRYQGSYEIVVSDNSTNGSQEIYKLVQELKDDRIKYYKTPRDLHLPKSFEFAYLQARGEFIFSLGSDDGILPWALDILKHILDGHPGQEIVKWDRGTYGWPGLERGQENQFTLPRYYQKDHIPIVMEKSADLLAHILKNPKSMYAVLPMMYINSGFRRSYFHTLLEKTGRLWDGICQDIYAGVINISIYKNIMHIQYPITIAGMSNGSIGKVSNSAVIDYIEANKELDEALKTNNVGGFSSSGIERLLPILKSDISSLYNSILRAVARGVMPKVYLEELFDWYKIYLDLITLMDKADVYFDKNVHYLRYTAAKHGEEFLKWFDESVYPRLMRPEEVKETDTIVENEGTRCYKTGFYNGQLTVDASDFGVENIYDAVRLFEKIAGL